MNLETFTAHFEEMCKVKFPNGATVMEIFLHLNNPNLTLGEITTYLENLKAHGKCSDMSIQEGNDYVNIKILYKYIVPPQPSPNASSSIPFKEIGALFGPDAGAIIEKIGPLMEKIMATQEAEKKILLNEKKMRHAQMMEIQKQILEHQKLILAAMTKPPMSVSQWTPFPNNNNSASIFQSGSPITSTASTSQSTPTPPAATTTSTTTPSMKVTEVKVKSFTEPNQFYNLNLDTMTCSCPNYIHHQSTLNPPGKCKHLLAAINNGVDKMIK